MNALLLAGGRGTRLRPLTDTMPKPMVPIMNVSLLERNILRLKSSGVKEFVISTCYRPTYICNRLGDGSKYGVKIHYVHENTPLGTAGAVKNAAKHFTDTFIVLNSDIVSDINVTKLIEYHKSKKAVATIAVTYVDDPTQYGVIEYDENHYITSFKEKPKKHEVTSNYINAGLYVFEPDILDQIPSNQNVSIEKETFPLLLEKKFKMAVYHNQSYWIDIGTPEKYLKVHRDILDGKCKSFEQYDAKHWNKIGHLILRGENTNIHHNAQIIGPVFVGDHVVIESGAMIGPYAVIGDNSYISSGCRVLGSVLLDHVHLSKNVKVINTIVGQKCKIGDQKELSNIIYTSELDYSVAV